VRCLSASWTFDDLPDRGYAGETRFVRLTCVRTCIYCTKEKADKAFNSEHVLSQGFGMFDPNLTLSDVCCRCNKWMGDKIETNGIRGSVEGLHRHQTTELRDPEALAKTPSRRVIFERQEPEWEGVRVFVKLSDDGTDVDMVLPPQVRIVYKDGSRTNYLLPDLPATLDPPTISYYRAYGTSKEDLASVIAAIEALGVRPKWQEPVKELPDELKSQVTARVVYDDLSRRLVAKIAFNFLAHVRGADLPGVFRTS
jgi:hypothetical protein